MKKMTLAGWALGSALLLMAVAAPVRAATMSFQADHDNTIIGPTSNADGNFGASNFFAVGRIQSDMPFQRSIISFDVGGLDGQFYRIDSITLRLTHSGNAASTVTLTNDVYAISDANRAWIEGTKTGQIASGESSWNNLAHGSTSWAGSAGLGTAGIDYDSTLLASRMFTASPDNLPNDGDVIDFNFTGSSAQLTALINSWLVDNVTNSQKNPGLLLLDPNAASFTGILQRTVFHSSEAANASFRPQLIVTYIIPEPSTMLLAGLGLLGLLSRRPRRG